MAEQIINIDRMEQTPALFGSFDENIKRIEQRYRVQIINRGEDIKVVGNPEAAACAARALGGMLEILNKGETLNEQNIGYVMSLVDEGNEDRIRTLFQDCICISAKGKPVKAKTLGQKKYTDAIAANTVVLGVGPAGTGKTYLAVAMAVKAFRANEVNRIILTRPAVEAGERLGFLPGDLQNKVDPYLRPLYDALFEMLGAETGAREYRGGAFGVYERAHTGRFLYHSGRGAEHHAGADEDVLDPIGLRLQGGHHRRCDPDRPAGQPPFRLAGRHAGAAGYRGYRDFAVQRKGCGAA